MATYFIFWITVRYPSWGVISLFGGLEGLLLVFAQTHKAWLWGTSPVVSCVPWHALILVGLLSVSTLPCFLAFTVLQAHLVYSLLED